MRVDLADDECINVEKLAQPLHWQVPSHGAICEVDVSRRWTIREAVSVFTLHHQVGRIKHSWNRTASHYSGPN